MIKVADLLTGIGFFILAHILTFFQLNGQFLKTDWFRNNQFRRLFVKYEDLITNKYETFRDIIVFTNTLIGISNGINGTADAITSFFEGLTEKKKEIK